MLQLNIVTQPVDVCLPSDSWFVFFRSEVDPVPTFVRLLSWRKVGAPGCQAKDLIDRGRGWKISETSNGVFSGSMLIYQGVSLVDSLVI